MFIILVLIFVLQTIWLYIKELAGKDLDIVVILKFLAYFMPKLMPLVLPLTILLASIMVFGSFAENYEFAAMKSTGISLQRAMSGLSLFIVALGILTFFFSNNIIPWAELNSYNLRKNIAKVKPSMAIAEGQFNKIEGTNYNIKVAKKSGDTGQYLEDVTIHMRGNDGRTNTTVIKSKTGEFISSKDSDVINLVLFDGHIYKDNPGESRKRKDLNQKPFAKSSFEKKVINIDLSNMNDVDFDEQSQTDKYNMLDIAGLNKSIDSLVIRYHEENLSFANNLSLRSGINKQSKTTSQVIKDSVYTGSILALFDTEQKLTLVETASKSSISSKQLITSKEKTIKYSKAYLNRHLISLHEKFALGFACVILFFVGAPLGALIKKGGIGLPMVIAILLFLTYHFIGIFAVNSAKSGDFNPIIAPWFSTLLMFPLGIFLTTRATADRNIFEFGDLFEPFKALFKFKSTEARQAYKFLSAYTEDELINTIENYKSLGHDENTRHEATKVLKSRGFSLTELRARGIAINENFDTTENIKTDYKDHSKFALTLYIIAVILIVLFFVFKNNKALPLALASMQLSIVSFVLYVIYFIKSIVNMFQFYNQINKKQDKPQIFLLLLGMPFYFLTNPLLNQKIKEDFKATYLKALH